MQLLKKTLLIIPFLVIKAASYGQIAKKTYYDFKKTQIMESFFVNSQGLKNGLYIKYDNRGIKAIEATFVKGVLEGPGKDYYLPFSGTAADGRLKTTGKYKQGEKDGVWILYDYVNNGQPFNGDQELKTGKQVKKMEEFYKLGVVYREITYYPNGQVKKDFFVQDGPYKSFYENGKPYRMTTNKNSVFDGEYVTYNSKGQIAYKGSYAAGYMVGEWVVARDARDYYPTVGKEDEMVYTRTLFFNPDGKVDQTKVSTSHYLDGTLRDSCYIESLGYYGEDRLAAGDFSAYYPNGKMKEKGRINTSGRKTGVWEYYTEDGNLRESINHN